MNDFPGAKENRMFEDVHFLYGDLDEGDEYGDAPSGRRKRVKNYRQNGPRREKNPSSESSRRGKEHGRSQSDNISFTYDC